MEKEGALLNRLFLVISLIIVVVLSGCGTAATTKDGVPAQTAAPKEKIYSLNEKASPIDGISITLTKLIKVKDIKGDEVKDELSGDKGYYVANLNNLAMANDYSELNIDVLAENITDKAVSLSEIGWSAKLFDGYKVEAISASKSLSGQIASYSSVNGSIVIIIDKSLSDKEFLLTYSYLDYNDEWKQAMRDVISSKMTKDEYEGKFKPILVKWKLNI